MTVEASITINASKAAIWAAISNVDRFHEVFRGVEKVEVLERPEHGIIGLRWRETRLLFGKPATVEKLVIAGFENEFYTTRSIDSGFVFTTYHRITDHMGPLMLRSTHETRPQGFTAILKALPMIFFKGMIRKAIIQDLEDIKSHVEQTWQGDFAILTPPMLPSRPCSFCLCLQGGSVFADFDFHEDRSVSLRRISYDGFGCCEPRVPLTRMNKDDSRLLMGALERKELGDPKVEAILRGYFQDNKGAIWSDALEKHDLL